MTGPNVIVNDVMIDPRNPKRVLLATDRSGVLSSVDGAQTFTASNRGFAHRQITALVVDRNNSDTLYTGVINDKEFGACLSLAMPDSRGGRSMLASASAMSSACARQIVARWS